MAGDQMSNEDEKACLSIIGSEKIIEEIGTNNFKRWF